MYLGNNPTALRSQRWIMDSFLELLETKSYEKITVKEITEKSDLARQTFYQLFNSKLEILEYFLDLQFNEYLIEVDTLQIIDFTSLARLYFHFFTKNKDFINHLINNNLTGLLNAKFTEYLPQILTHVSNEIIPNHAYVYEFLSSGLVGVLVYWFRQDLDVSIDDLVKTLNSLIHTSNTI